MRWSPVRNAPLDGTAVFVRCGDRPEDHHLVSYVGGSWIDVHGGYILSESETGLPLDYTLLGKSRKQARGKVWRIFSQRQLCVMAFLATAALKLLLGATAENCLDLLPGQDRFIC